MTDDREHLAGHGSAAQDPSTHIERVEPSRTTDAPLDARTLLARRRRLPPMDLDKLRADMDQIIDPSMDRAR